MAGQRTRRRRYQWLPVQGTDHVGVDPREWTTYQFFDTPVINSVTPSVFAFPLIRDEAPQNDASTSKTNTLTNSQDLIIERVVGSIYVNAFQYEPNDGDSATGIVATAGIAVLPVSEQAPTNPLVGTGLVDLSPTKVDNSDQPWMWRRQWLLSNFIPPATLTYGGGPATNAQFGDLLGPHIDVRSVRRIRQNERLFCIIEVAVWPPTNSAYDTGARGAFTIDVRVLGTGRKSRTDGTLTV